MQEVLPRLRSKIIVDEQGRSVLPLLNLDAPGREPRKETP